MTLINIHVGNLTEAVSENDLTKAFKVYGEVISVSIIRDKVDGKTKEFAYVVMQNQSEGQAAIDGLNSKMVNGCKLTVSDA